MNVMGTSHIVISLLTFWSVTKSTHNDCHIGNFLYIKIPVPKKKEFFKYNIFGKDIYIENLGFLWTTWDYGFAKPYNINYNYNKF